MVASEVVALSVAELRDLMARLAVPASTAGDALARVTVMEELRSVLAAAQAAAAATYMTARRAEIDEQIATVSTPGVGTHRRREHAERHAVAEIAKARRISPWQARRFTRWATTAPTATPATFTLLAGGRLSERRATLVFELTAPLTDAQRLIVDRDLAPELSGWGDRQVDRQTRAAVYRVDPSGACQRAAYAAEQRRVTTRPAPDTMAWLTLLAPVAQVVACRAALEQAATAARSAGDPRPRGAVMADTLVERVTGQTTAAGVPIAVQLLIDADTLTGRSDTPARLADGTPMPAPIARDLVLDTDTTLRVRRLFTDPAGRLITAETHARDFTPAMAEFVRLRDGICATPWCDAPIRHTDHHDPHTRGGRTSLTNARGLCQWCNQTKADRPPERPDAPRPPARPQRSRLERRVRRQLRRASRRKATILVDLPPHRCMVQQ